MRLSSEEWNKLVTDHEVKDISQPHSEFLMFGQIGKGEVLYKGKEWSVTIWHASGPDPAYVEMHLLEGE